MSEIAAPDLSSPREDNPTERGDTRGDDTLQDLLATILRRRKKIRTLIRRPRLKCRTISPNSSEIAIMQPINHRLFLLQSSIPLPVIRT